ncbi:MAG: hypothetical protein LBU43_07290 [Candidatus Accumulibacter sp.]|jgi:hypothetical protein|nr:hypothetical protein [Accumulibacter sp.]
MPHSVPQPAGLFVPQALLHDARLKPTERNAWIEFRSLADKNGIATVSHESLRAALPCAPGSQKAAMATVSRIVLCLRLSTWLGLIGYRRNPRTGFTMAGCYTVRTEPLSFVEACLGDEDYLPLLERGLAHSLASVRHLARNILDQAMLHRDELSQLSIEQQEHVRRLYQQAHSPEDEEDGSGGGGISSHCEPDQTDLHVTPTIPKSTPKTSETVRTVNNNVYKEVPTYRAPQTEVPGQDALARFRQLAADQQDYLSGRLRALPPEQRRDVLAEWNVRCAAGAVRDAAAYLFGLIRKALQGTFRLWAARKNSQARPAPKVQETLQGTKPPSTSPVMALTGQPVSREVALAHLQRIKAVLQGGIPVTRAMAPPNAGLHRHRSAPWCRPRHRQASRVRWRLSWARCEVGAAPTSSMRATEGVRFTGPSLPAAVTARRMAATMRIGTISH